MMRTFPLPATVLEDLEGQDVLYSIHLDLISLVALMRLN